MRESVVKEGVEQGIGDDEGEIRVSRGKHQKEGAGCDIEDDKEAIERKNTISQQTPKKRENEIGCRGRDEDPTNRSSVRPFSFSTKLMKGIKAPPTANCMAIST